jgi:hypothetical protein
VNHVLINTMVFVAGMLLGIRVLAALYAPIDLWYTIRTAWPVALRRIAGWSATAAAVLLLLPAGGPRRVLVAGMALSLLVHVGTWFLVIRAFSGKPGPSPVVE